MDANLTRHLADPLPAAAVGGTVDLRPGIESRARRIHELTRRVFPAWTPPPFDPALMAEALGIPVQRTRTPRDVHAMLVPNADTGFRILCDSETRSPGRTRFSIAHELVHTFFDDAPRIVSLRSQPKGSRAAADLERLCDAGAAELLMPRGPFTAVLRTRGLRASTVSELAERFAVSLQAALVRILECADRSLRAAGIFEYALRPSSLKNPTRDAGEIPRYRVSRVFARPGAPWLFPHGKSVPDDSVIVRASLGRTELSATESFRLGATETELHVLAFPLPGTADDGPPRVCALFLGAAAGV